MMSEGTKQFLVVDDSTTMRQLIKMVLKKDFSCEVEEARDGLEALEKYDTGTFDLIVTDINMPRMDGLLLVERLRAEKGAKLPIVIVTTRGGEKDRDRGLALGASGYVAKPINGSQLSDLVRSLLP